MEKLTRRAARENAFIAAFEAVFRPDEVGEIIVCSREMGEPVLDGYGEMLLRSWSESRQEIDAMIARYLKGWTLSRLPKTSLALLRIAIAEMRFGSYDHTQENVDSIVINEAVELAKKYGGDDDYQFINGVLGAVSRSEKL